jgi:hypothetical protein
MKALLDADRALAKAHLQRADPRGTYPLHVAAEFGQAAAASFSSTAAPTLIATSND